MAPFDFLDNKKLKNQLAFLIEIDKMKCVFRRTLLLNEFRRENDAEHSWHFALYAMILQEYCKEEIDINKVIKIALVHDLVEVYAGDTFAYDEKGGQSKKERETAAAEKLFGILDKQQGAEIRALWDEFEEKKTPEARYANACDRIQPLIHNYLNDGFTWKEGNVHAPAVLERMAVIKEAAPELWQVVVGIIEDSINKGILKP